MLQWTSRARTRDGRPYENGCIGVFTIHDGKIQDVREYMDTLYASEVAFTGSVGPAHGYRGRGVGMRIFVAGASGVIGVRLVPLLVAAGHDVAAMTRSPLLECVPSEVLDAGGIVIRYGQLYGPDTYHETAKPDPPRIHIDKAARRTVPFLEAPSGIVEIVGE